MPRQIALRKYNSNTTYTLYYLTKCNLTCSDVECCEAVFGFGGSRLAVSRHPERVVAVRHQVAHFEVGLGGVHPLGHRLPALLATPPPEDGVVQNGATAARPRP